MLATMPSEVVILFFFACHAVYENSHGPSWTLPPPPLRRILAQNPPPPLKEFLDPPLIRSGARVRPNVYIGLTCVAMG